MSEENKELETVAEATERENDTLAEPERTVVFEEALEAILFAAGHPISYATLARVFEVTPATIKDKVLDYSLKYNNSDIPRGVILLTYGDSCQLCTKKYYLNEIREALGIKRSGTLSTSSMEALAIVAYNQPVTRAFVDTLRRADSSYAMNNLLDRGLIEARGRLDAPGRPMLYGTTSDFLRAFGLKDISALPTTTEEIKEMFDKATAAEGRSLGVQEEMSFPEIDGKAVPEAEDEPNTTTEKKDLIAAYEEDQSAEDDIINDDL